MIEAVADVLALPHGQLVVSAPTGVGKSFALLIPAIASERRCIFLTGTKALQDQLAGTDLPFLAAEMGDPTLTYAVLKGQSNYLCLQRLGEAMGDGTLLQSLSNPDAELQRIAEWSKTTATGDLSEINVTAPTRKAITIEADGCPGQRKCPRGAECFVIGARHRARTARIVVTNMAIFGVDIATEGALLGSYDVVIVDEAHKLEDAVAGTLGNEISAGELMRLSAELRRIDTTNQALLADLAAAGDDLAAAMARAVTDAVLLDYPLPDVLQSQLIRTRDLLDEALEVIETHGTWLTTPSGHADFEGNNPPVQRLWQKTQGLRARVSTSLFPTEDDACFVDADKLRIVPLDVSERLAADAWAGRVVIHASATVPTNHEARIGLTDARRLTVESPFDFERNAVLYLAKDDVPNVNDREWGKIAYPRMSQLIEAAGGRTLALFSSYRAMREAADAVRRRGLRVPIYTQDDGTKNDLIARLKTDRCAVFATQGFYEGVDVPGEALSLVIIDRIPFPHRNDPLNTARSRVTDGGWFNVDLPRATTLLTQAVGRLIRTSSDRGVVAIFDNRLFVKYQGYGGHVVAQLPAMRRTGDIDVAADWLRKVTSPPDQLSDADQLDLVGAW